MKMHRDLSIWSGCLMVAVVLALPGTLLPAAAVGAPFPQATATTTPLAYLPYVVRQHPPSTPTPTVTVTPTATATPVTPTPTPTTPPADGLYYPWPGGILEADSYGGIAIAVHTCYTSDCLDRWTASLAGDMVGTTYWITGTIVVDTNNAYAIYFRFLLAHDGVETPLVAYRSDLTPGTWGFSFQPLNGPDPQAAPGDALIFEIDRRGNRGTTRLEVTRGGSSGLRLLAPAAPLSPPASFTRGYVAYSAADPYALDAADLDGDHDQDVVYLSETGKSLNWRENDGHQNFSWHTIASGLDLPINNASVQVVDVEHDGDADVVAPVDHSAFAWWENDGAQNFTRHDLTCNRCYPEVIHAADLDGDTDTDFAAAGYGFAWWENDGAQNFTRRPLASAGSYTWVYPVDLDQDTDTDLLAAFATGTLTWWENDGHQNFSRRDIRSISSTTVGDRTTLRPADFDGDGDLDLLSASDVLDELAWWENDSSQNFTRHALVTGVTRPLDLMAAPLDGDADMDLVAAGAAFAWYEATGGGFLRHLFGRESAVAIAVVDVDGDGRLDVVSGDQADGQIYWWKNPATSTTTREDLP